jgi:hypothetical protein
MTGESRVPGSRWNVEFKCQLVGITPEPRLAGLERTDDGMVRCAVVSRGMPARRIVATPDMPAVSAHA